MEHRRSNETSDSSTLFIIFYRCTDLLHKSFCARDELWLLSARLECVKQKKWRWSLILSQFAVLTTTESCANLVGLSIVWTLSILGQLDVLNHFSKKRVAVVFVLGHQHFQHKPEAPTHTQVHTLSAVVWQAISIFFCTNHHRKQMNQPVLTLWCLSAGRILVVL